MLHGTEIVGGSNEFSKMLRIILNKLSYQAK